MVFFIKQGVGDSGLAAALAGEAGAKLPRCAPRDLAIYLYLSISIYLAISLSLYIHIYIYIYTYIHIHV